MTKKVLISIITVLIIVIGILGFSFVKENMDSGEEQETTQTNNDSSESAELETSSPSGDGPSTDTIREIMQEKLTTITGLREGVSTAIQPIVTFPNSTLEITASQTFQLNAAGFDLALLGNDSLAIEEGVFPEARIIASGQIEIDGIDAFMNIDTLTPEFYVVDNNGEEQVLDTQIQAQLLGGVRAAQIEIPIVSKSSPITVPIDIQETIFNGYSIETTEDAEDFYFSFETTS